ncbi:RNA pseudouridine synthase, partial [Paeniclostridium sordellii]|uniref:pseudouridine synthase n=1 Tax=Paraclostridium sordellii TaxID=1505 RepID=UPI00210C55E0
NDFGTIDEPIYRQEEDSMKRIVDERGQRSVTHYKVLQRLNDATVLEVKLETGRTHQIRVHMNYIGHGIIGMLKYQHPIFIFVSGSKISTSFDFNSS